MLWPTPLAPFWGQGLVYVFGGLLRDAIVTMSGLNMGAWRFNLRASNTEPVLRFNVETRGDAALLAESVARVRELVDG